MSLPFPQALSPDKRPLAYAFAQLVLVIPIIIAGNRFYIVGFKSLLHRSPNMGSLLAVGTTAAVVYSLYNVWQVALGHVMAAHSLYFETAAAIVALILFGKSLEALSKGRTSEAIKKLMGLAPKTAIIVEGGAEKEIPVDGVVTEGQTAIDESMLTGESMPGDKVYAETINSNGVIQFKAEKTGSDTALAQIIRLVEDAQGSKSPIAQMADIVSSYFVPIVCGIAVIAGIAWFAAASSGLGALPHGKSVLVIVCPCALGLATPTAIMVRTGKGAEKIHKCNRLLVS